MIRETVCMARRMAISALIAMTVTAVTANAADRFSSGTKDWDTSSSNWGTNSAGLYTTTNWNNATPDSAIFEGTPGTVTLSTNITSAGIRFDVTGYTITSNASASRLSFANDATIRCDVASATIIPDIDATTDIRLSGTGSGTLASKTFGSPNVTKSGAGTWTWEGGSPYGDGRSVGNVVINEGVLKASGTIGLAYSKSLTLNSGGEFHYNATNTLYSPDGNGRGWNLRGGRLDNSSGAPIVSTAWMGFSLNQDTTFIGSKGADSDLTLNVIGTWTDGKKLTVSNALATLTLHGNDYAGGLKGPDDIGIIKDGAGTLVLTNNINYVGNTTIEDGVLSIKAPYMHADSYVYLTNSGILDLDFVGTNTITGFYTNGVLVAGGVWGPSGSGAPNESDSLTGSGRLNVLYGIPVPGKRWWEGGTADVGGDGDAVSTGGAGTWDATTKNWDAGVAVAHTNWNNAATDVAYIYGTPGTITLAEDITLGGIYLDADADGYVIAGNALNFAADSTIEYYDTMTIASDIVGSPDIIIGGYKTLVLSGNSVAIDQVSNGGYVTLGGSGTGSVVAFNPGNLRPTVTGGVWTVGTINTAYGTTIDNGVLKITNRIEHTRNDTAQVRINGGELHCNSVSTFTDTAAIGGAVKFYIYGGALDNSSGGPITLSLGAGGILDERWYGDFMFIGSGGADSDLDMGTGGQIVMYNADRAITVSNAAATFTVSRPIGDGGNGYGFTKAGEGTLRLTGANTYTGDTIVNGGTLSLDGSRALVDSTSLWITNSALVHLPAGVFESVGRLVLDGVQAANGTWGSTASSAANKDDTYFSGPGVLVMGEPILYSSGTKTWDTVSSNWGDTTGGPYDALAWPNSAPIASVFEGTPGLTTISGAITNSGIRFDVAGHTITSATGADSLTLRDGSTIQSDVAGATIDATVHADGQLTLSGTGSGTIGGYVEAGGFNISGSLVKAGSGGWTLLAGAPKADGRSIGNVTINEGILKAFANLNLGYTKTLTINSGGAFHYNAVNTLFSPDGNGRAWFLDGGRLDNSSGSAIVCTKGASLRLREDSMFVGSGGAASHLALFDTVFWTDGKTLTVSNALTTLTLSGVVRDADTLGIIKDGAGTLRLSGANTYLGDTFVNEGTLSLDGSAALVDSTTLWVTNGAMVFLAAGVDEVVTNVYRDAMPGGFSTWGSSSSLADNVDDSFFAGPGVLRIAGPTPIANMPPTELTTTSATFNAVLNTHSANMDVFVFWGTTDGVADPSAWSDTAYIGAWTNANATNISFSTSGLISGATYWYSFRSSSDVAQAWGRPSMGFIPLGPPLATNLGASAITLGSATLTGGLTFGGTADAFICWGKTDPGTPNTGDWANVISFGLVSQVPGEAAALFSSNVTGLVGGEYFTRVYVTNVYGADWSEVETFRTPQYLFWDGGDSDIGADGDGLSNGSNGTWSTSIANWDAGAGVAHTNWHNDNLDIAYLGGTNGTIVLAEDIILGGLHLESGAAGYIITNQTLNFLNGGWVRNLSDLTIASDIIGSPSINQGDTLTLVASDMLIGPIDGGYRLNFQGSGTGVVSGTISGDNTTTYKSGTGTWVVDTIASRRETVVEAGVLIVTNALAPYSSHTRAFEINGGELHCNSVDTFQSASMSVYIDGGALDNSSGAALTLDQTAAQQWRGDFMFIGSQGTNSDLSMGTGGSVLLTSNRTVTVSNALTTFAVGSPISDGGNGYALTKEGAGTLKLYGNNTYSGDTFVKSGALSLAGSSVLADNSSLWISTEASVFLQAGVNETVSNLYIGSGWAVKGTWGSSSSGAMYTHDGVFSGTGILTTLDGGTYSAAAGILLIVR
jgi:fibronectin-binding autotransporter adhesin